MNSNFIILTILGISVVCGVWIFGLAAIRKVIKLIALEDEVNDLRIEDDLHLICHHPRNKVKKAA